MKEEKPLADGDYLLQKFPGKGGWTYTEIPEIKQNRKSPFGWVRVKGSIDGYPLSQYKLMPMGNGKLFLPVKAAIRKKIGKQEGDTVRVILYADDSPVEIPEELMLCFESEPGELFGTFTGLPEGERKSIIDWIYDAKTEATKTNRIVKLMDRLGKKA